MKGRCSICGAELRSRKSSKHSAKYNFLAKVRKHMWKEHRNTMIRRIKAGKRAKIDNPSVQDFISALRENTTRAVSIYMDFQESQYQYIKKMMDALEPALDPEVQIAWKIIEAIHDA